jgi:DNA-binding GntR family transcriptional regulator
MTAPQESAGSVLPSVHRKKPDIAYDYLREQVVNGSFAPGQRVTLAEMSAACGMSQMPVREAMLRLQREGLLESEPHKGMRVVELSLRDARELFAIRTELEGLAAHSACAAKDSALVADLQQINQHFIDALATADLPAMGAANSAFHQRIRHAAGNAQLGRMLHDLWTGSQRYRMGYKLIPGRAEGTIIEHARIITAIASGDPEQARAAARDHIQRAWIDLATVFGSGQAAEAGAAPGA